mmetsp:Transcript_2701/g.6531  ORF Transcript_2701/g.6531 Transcript_2701/m.6531 type:complete len:792 (-) Transcript_2701:56-2431(-)
MGNVAFHDPPHCKEAKDRISKTKKYQETLKDGMKEETLFDVLHNLGLLRKDDAAGRGMCRQLFMALDRDNSGTVDFKEFSDALPLLLTGLSVGEKADFIFDRFDSNSDNYVTEDELRRGLKRQLRQAAKVALVDLQASRSNGAATAGRDPVDISPYLLSEMAGNAALLDDLVRSAMREGDSDGDGRLTRDEFRKWLEEHPSLNCVRPLLAGSKTGAPPPGTVPGGKFTEEQRMLFEKYSAHMSMKKVHSVVSKLSPASQPAGLPIGAVLVLQEQKRLAAARKEAKADAPPRTLPDRIHIKTSHLSFTRMWYIAVWKGRLYFKLNPDYKHDVSSDDLNIEWKGVPFQPSSYQQWQLLPPDGLPTYNKPSDLLYKNKAEDIIAVDTDDLNVVALDQNNVIHYMKWVEAGVLFEWMGAWGMPNPKYLEMPLDNRGWGVSHRSRNTAGGYEDVDGNWVPSHNGVTSLFMLCGDGRFITLVDPWLPPAWYHHYMPLPERNTYVALNLAVSASTIFVINNAARMYTLLADFDIVGDNPALDYSYRHDKRPAGSMANLPPEDWRLQPSIHQQFPQAKITRDIMIQVLGRGNASRELRVRGQLGGAWGLFRKMIFDAQWAWVPTGEVPPHPPVFLDPVAAPETQPCEDMEGGPVAAGKQAEVKVLNFNRRQTMCAFEFAVPIGGEWRRYLFHMHYRQQVWRSEEGKISWKGTLLLGPDLCQEKSTEVACVLKEVFGEGNRIVPVKVKYQEDTHQLVITERSSNLLDRITNNDGQTYTFLPFVGFNLEWKFSLSPTAKRL